MDPTRKSEITIDLEMNERTVKPNYADASASINLFVSILLKDPSVTSISMVKEVPVDGSLTMTVKTLNSA